jgi:hypothetical protein
MRWLQYATVGNRSDVRPRCVVSLRLLVSLLCRNSTTPQLYHNMTPRFEPMPKAVTVGGARNWHGSLQYEAEENQHQDESQFSEVPGSQGFPRWAPPNKSVPGFPGERREPPAQLLHTRSQFDKLKPQDGTIHSEFYLLPPLPPSTPPPARSSEERLEAAVERMRARRPTPPG